MCQGGVLAQGTEDTEHCRIAGQPHSKTRDLDPLETLTMSSICCLNPSSPTTLVKLTIEAEAGYAKHGTRQDSQEPF